MASKEASEAASSPEPVLAIEDSSPAVQVPNGGVFAWLQAAGAFCLYFCTWGLVSSFGTFQTIYESGRLKQHTPFQISVIGSLQTFLMVFLGFLVGPIYDAGYFRALLATGSSLLVLGTVFQSLASRYWHFVLTQGAMVGVGMGCLSILSVAVTSLWFTSRLPLANGLAACGSGFGGVLLPIMLRELHPKIGLGWTIRAMALLLLVLLGFANLVLRARATQGPRQRRSLIDPDVFGDWPFMLFVLGCFTVFLGLYTPFVHVGSYALAEDIVAPDVALYILAILNGSSILGRILPSLVAQRVGPMNMIIVTSLALGITSLCLMATTSFARLVVVIIVQGFFTGTFFALQPTIFVRLTADGRKMGTRFGMAFCVMSFALLFGPPISGALRSAVGYGAAWVWAGVTVLAGGTLIATARVVKGGRLAARL